MAKKMTSNPEEEVKLPSVEEALVVLKDHCQSSNIKLAIYPNGNVEQFDGYVTDSLFHPLSEDQRQFEDIDGKRTSNPEAEYQFNIEDASDLISEFAVDTESRVVFHADSSIEILPESIDEMDDYEDEECPHDCSMCGCCPEEDPQMRVILNGVPVREEEMRRKLLGAIGPVIGPLLGKLIR